MLEENFNLFDIDILMQLSYRYEGVHICGCKLYTSRVKWNLI